MNKIGVLFTTINYNPMGDTVVGIANGLIKNFAHVYTDSIVTDTINWTTISGSFISDSAYQYILIGNFFDTANTNFSCTNGLTYYLVDDICVSDSANTCGSTIGIKEFINSEIFKIYPNPSNDKVFIETSEREFCITI